MAYFRLLEKIWHKFIENQKSYAFYKDHTYLRRVRFQCAKLTYVKPPATRMKRKTI